MDLNFTCALRVQHSLPRFISLPREANGFSSPIFQAPLYSGFGIRYSKFGIRPRDPSEYFSLPSGVLNLWLGRMFLTPSYAAKQAAL
jgi:hypothetical protein